MARAGLILRLQVTKGSGLLSLSIYSFVFYHSSTHIREPLSRKRITGHPSRSRHNMFGTSLGVFSGFLFTLFMIVMYMLTFMFGHRIPVARTEHRRGPDPRDPDSQRSARGPSCKYLCRLAFVFAGCMCLILSCLFIV